MSKPTSLRAQDDAPIVEPEPTPEPAPEPLQEEVRTGDDAPGEIDNPPPGWQVDDDE